MRKLVIGLTGGIGSGKSTVASLFRNLGIAVVDADKCSRIVVEPGQPALREIVRHFGNNILLADGNLDRKQLRTIIFTNPAEKTWLENLLHPLILDEIRRQLASASSPYAMLESPLLVETGQSSLCHRILVVDVTEQQQIERTMQRDNNSRELVSAIMHAQATRAQRLNSAHDVINNTGDLRDLETQAALLHKQYLELATTEPTGENT